MARRKPFAPTRDAKTSLDRVAPALRGVQKELTTNGEFRLKETDTGQTWIDGRVIYRKVIEMGVLPDTAAKTLEHNIEIVSLVRAWGVASSGSSFLTLPVSPVSALTEGVSLEVTDTDVVVTTGSDRTAYTWAYVVLEYTR